MYAGAATDRLFAQGTAIIDPARQTEWLRATLLPAMQDLYPVAPVLEYQEGVLGLGPKVASWSRFDLHSFGLQWLTPK